MTGRDDAAAAEQAELETLRRRADERRKELGDTLDALTAKLAADTDMRRWAQRATAGLGRATVAAAWRALPGNGSAGGTAGALQRAG
ncbi:MAG: DUF3618 domain-containing protein, partial [Actinobacteria bacterium]|nr:DUF3618 domain-containing protein [Actinomycetota bacterium]